MAFVTARVFGNIPSEQDYGCYDNLNLSRQFQGLVDTTEISHRWGGGEVVPMQQHPES